MTWLLNFRTGGKADTIGLVQFINFMNDCQRDPRLNEILYPLYDEKRSLEIICTYEQDEQNREKSKQEGILCMLLHISGVVYAIGEC